jgi:hypothetical protein
MKVKCVCGYEYKRISLGVELNEIAENVGDEPFIEFTLSNDIKLQARNKMGEYEEVFLLACPKCHTVVFTDYSGNGNNLTYYRR